jgi:dinuclear metal center YbgI/SA1388 family protein
MVKVKDIISIANQLAPEKLAYDWDNVGLQVGYAEQTVERVLITLDITEDVVDEALEKGCQLIISHHPLIFSPLKAIRYETAIGRIMKKIINNNLSIYVMHTNLDLANGGLNDYLSARLDLKDCGPLEIKVSNNLYKLVVFIPVDSFGEVQKAILDAGAGFIGKYSHASFSIEGTGTFKPLKGSKPYIGKQECFTEVKERRLETIVEEERLNEVIEVMLEKHPYEEVAYDIYPLKNQGETFSLGRIGYLDKGIVLQDYLSSIKEIFNLKQVRFIGQKSREIKKVAICGGSGSELIKRAYQMRADLFITGDIKYHQAQLAEQLDLALIDAGHFQTEIFITSLLSDYFKDNLQGVVFLETGLNTNPWNYG